MTVLTWRDIGSGPAGQVQGDKRVWRALSALDAVDSAVYWLFGRRRARPP